MSILQHGLKIQINKKIKLKQPADQIVFVVHQAGKKSENNDKLF